MAKVTSPLMSMDASGSLGGAITFAKWKGRNYVRQLVIPSNPQTSGQQDARAALGGGGKFNSVVDFGSPADLAEKDAAPSGQSGASNFVKLVTQRWVAEKAKYVNVTNATIKGYFDAGAVDAGLLGFTVPGETPLVVPAGLILWVAYEAMHSIDPTLAPSTAVTASEANVATFTDSLAV